MGSRKQNRRQRTTSATPFSHPSNITPIALRKIQQQQLQQQQLEDPNNNNNNSSIPAADAVPTCIPKLRSDDPSVREEACIDIARFSQTESSLEALLRHNVTGELLAVISSFSFSSSSNQPPPQGGGEFPAVVAAAATALRHVLVYAEQHNLELVLEYLQALHDGGSSAAAAPPSGEATTTTTMAASESLTQELVVHQQAASRIIATIVALSQARAVALQRYLLGEGTTISSSSSPSTVVDEAAAAAADVVERECDDEANNNAASATTTPLEALDDLDRALEELFTLCGVFVEGCDDDSAATTTGTAFCEGPFLPLVIATLAEVESLLLPSSSSPAVAAPSPSSPYREDEEEGSASSASSPHHTTTTTTTAKRRLALDSFLPVATAAMECLFHLSSDNAAFQHWMTNVIWTSVPAAHLELVNRWCTPSTWQLQVGVGAAGSGAAAAGSGDEGDVISPFASSTTGSSSIPTPTAPQQQQQQQRILTPALLRLTVLLSGALYRSQPTNPATCDRICPFLYLALHHVQNPGVEWRRALPFLSESNNNQNPDLAKVVLQQTAHKLFNAQTALSILHEMISTLCEHQRSDVEDWVAFAENPMRYLILDCPIPSSPSEGQQQGEALPGTAALVIRLVRGVVATLLEHTGSVSSYRALREATPNPDASQLQHLFLSLEVVLLTVATNLLLLLPNVEAMFGPMPVVWRALCDALKERVELLHAEPEQVRITTESVVAKHRVQLCVESLTEMCWTLTRRASASGASSSWIVAEPKDWDLLTSLAWSSQVSRVTKTFVVGAVSTLATLQQQQQQGAATVAVNNAARFCVGILTALLKKKQQHQDQQDQQQPQVVEMPSSSSSLDDEEVDLAAQTADALMDLFSDESFDAALYVPLRVHAAMQFVATLLQEHLTRYGYFGAQRSQQQRKGSRGGKQTSSATSKAEGLKTSSSKSATATAPPPPAVGWTEATAAQIEAVAEVWNNVTRFLVYKEQNCPGLS